jgi:hypothetical protein
MTQAGHDAIGKLLAVFDDDFIELVKYCKRVIDKSDPEPQADDVETIRALVEEHGIAQEFDIDDGVKLVRFALTRLSAPVDVQAKAEAVVQEFSDTYVMLSADTEYELSRLIVEQFSRKG